MRTALILEIEELLFDTRDVRTEALHDALVHEGASISIVRVAEAHAGVPVAMALQRLSAEHSLDATGSDLVLLRAGETATRAFSVQAPSFDTAARDALARLSEECPVGVVTRASSADAQRWLDGAGLEACVATVRSLAALDPASYESVWSDALRRAHATRGVAVASSSAMLRIARHAGLRGIQIGLAPDAVGDGYHPDARLESLSHVNAAFMASLLSSS